MFSGLRSNSMALSHVWLGLPGGRFQSDGGLQIAAATARSRTLFNKTVANTLPGIDRKVMPR